MTAIAEWSIQELARAAGTTSRTLRHYGEIGLLEPRRIGANGYRYYDQESLVRLQRIFLLRDLGLGLAVIAELLEGEQDPEVALSVHLELLEQQLHRVKRQIASVRSTLTRLEEGEQLMAEEAFDGFDHTQYKEEVIDRWGKDAYERSDSWYRSLSNEEKERFQQDQLDIATDFAEAKKAGEAPQSDAAQAVAKRLYRWVTLAWQGKEPSAEAFTALGEMYVADTRFTANYEGYGEGTARFIRDAMKVYADRHLE